MLRDANFVGAGDVDRIIISFKKGMVFFRVTREMEQRCPSKISE